MVGQADRTLADWLTSRKVGATAGFRHAAADDAADLRLAVDDTNFVLVSYLDDLRKKKLEESRPPRRIMLIEPDLRQHPIGEYYESDLKPVFFEKKTGKLFVSSSPPKATIRIDGNLKGETPAAFIVRPGRYYVDIFKQLPKPPHLLCNEDVDVLDGQVVTVTCYLGKKSKRANRVVSFP